MNKKRNGVIEIIRFFLALTIVLYHGMFGGNFSFRGGYLGVEAFFIISGFYLAEHCCKLELKSSLQIAHSTWTYVYRRVINIYPQMFIGTVIGTFFFYYINNWKLHDLALYMRYAVNDFFFLQNLGFPIASVTGVVWYLSSFLVSIIVLYPFFAKLGKVFFLYIAPICTLFISGILINNFGSFEVPASWLFGCINTGNLRAISMMCLGGFLYGLLPYVKVRLESYNRVVITVGEILFYCMFFLLLHLYSDGSGQFDEQAVFLFACGFMITESGLSYTIHFGQSKIAFFLGRYSVALYWGHFIWVQNAQAFTAKIGFMEENAQVVGLVCAFLSSLVIMCLEGNVRKLAHRFLCPVAARMPMKHAEQ